MNAPDVRMQFLMMGHMRGLVAAVTAATRSAVARPDPHERVCGLSEPEEKSVIQSVKSSTLRTVLIAPLTLLVFSGCQTADENRARHNDLVITRITAENTRDDGANLVVSTQKQGEALMFDPTQGEIAYDEIDLVCPNGLQMGMLEWFEQLEITLGVDVDALIAQEFTLASSRSDAVAALIKPAPQGTARPEGTETDFHTLDCRCLVCVAQDCYLCPDGVWVCTCTEWEESCDCG